MDNTTLYTAFRDTTLFFATIMLLKYTVFLLVAPFHRVKETLRTRRIVKNGNQDYQPLVSVVIPAWNEEVGIVSTIQSIVENDYEKIEIVVVNDGSVDNTDKLIRSYRKKITSTLKKSNKSLVYLPKENGGKGKALNHGIQKATGEIIITMDADSIAHPEMVRRIVHYFADDHVDAVVGNVKIAGEIGFINLLQRLEYLFGFYHKRAHSVLGAEYIYGGACAAFRHSAVFEPLGNFDTATMTEDIEMSMRTRYHGRTSVYADDAICYTEGASSVTSLLKQRLRWKKGRLEVFRKYKGLFFSLRARHNKWLTWFILPFALFGDIQLLFEPIGVTLLVVYSYITGDYSSILLGAFFIGIMYIIVGLFSERAQNWWLVPLFPFTWAMFYALVWIEYLALLKSLTVLVRDESIAWQKWQRKGVRIVQPKPAEALHEKS